MCTFMVCWQQTGAANVPRNNDAAEDMLLSDRRGLGEAREDFRRGMNESILMGFYSFIQVVSTKLPCWASHWTRPGALEELSLANGEDREFRQDCAQGMLGGHSWSGNLGSFSEAGRWTGRVKTGKDIWNRRNSMNKGTGAGFRTARRLTYWVALATRLSQAGPQVFSLHSQGLGQLATEVGKGERMTRAGRGCSSLC